LFSGPLPPQTAAQKVADNPSIANFHRYRGKSGAYSGECVCGVETKKYIIETTGTGVAILDYDNDGWPDIFIVNGTTLEGFPSGEAPPTTCITTIMTGLSRMSP